MISLLFLRSFTGGEIGPIGMSDEESADEGDEDDRIDGGEDNDDNDDDGEEEEDEESVEVTIDLPGGTKASGLDNSALKKFLSNAVTSKKCSRVICLCARIYRYVC